MHNEVKEEELVEKLDLLRKDGKIDEGIELLIKNTGKDKILVPSDTFKMERVCARARVDGVRSSNLLPDTLRRITL